MGFFDKLKEQASSLGQQLDQALDTTKQKSQLNSMRKRRGEMVSRLGENLLNQFREGEVDVGSLKPEVDEIFKLEWEIVELEKQIQSQAQAAPSAVTPPPTSPAPPPAADRAAPAPPQARAAEATPACPSCGKAVPPGSAFCPDCGTKIG
jgi:hypothetical protein